MTHLITLLYTYGYSQQHITELHFRFTTDRLEIITRSAEARHYKDSVASGELPVCTEMTDDYEPIAGLTQKENLLNVLAEIIDDYRFIYDIPRVEKLSPYVSEEDWAWITAKILKKTETTFTSRFIEFLKAQGLDPRAHDDEKGEWKARCVSGHWPPMKISAYFDEFECSHCKKRGGIDELREWINETVSSPCV